MKKTQSWVNLGLLAAASLVFLFLNQLLSTAWNTFRWPVPGNGDWPFEPSQVIAFVVAVGAALVIRVSAKANHFLNEVVEELEKVSWANREETFRSACVVVVMLVVAALVLFVIDSFWRFAIRGVLMS